MESKCGLPPGVTAEDLSDAGFRRLIDEINSSPGEPIEPSLPSSLGNAGEARIMESSEPGTRRVAAHLDIDPEGENSVPDDAFGEDGEPSALDDTFNR